MARGQFILTLGLREHGTFDELSPPHHLFQGSHELHPVSDACEYPPLAQYLAVQTSRESLRGQPLPDPVAGLAPPPCLLPHSSLTPPPLCSPANCGCLNGGTCVSYKYFSNIQRCSCPKKFQGEHCEIGMEILAPAGE